MPKLTQKRLRYLFAYCPHSGIFTRLIAMSSNAKVGDISGTIDSHGYRQINIDCKKYKASRLAFLYMNDELPKDCVDHINGVRNDDRWCNLREVTYQENNMNKSLFTNNISGTTGVSFINRDKTWRASISVPGKGKISLGHFKDVNMAIKARKDAEITYLYHENHGKVINLLGG
jgi:HNH endonuclease